MIQEHVPLASRGDATKMFSNMSSATQRLNTSLQRFSRFT